MIKKMVSYRMQIAWLLSAVGILNVATFLGIADLIGGDALNGMIEGGHYYLGNHGIFREVSQTVFTYSKWHGFSVFITQPIALLSLIAIGGERYRLYREKRDSGVL